MSSWLKEKIKKLFKENKLGIIGIIIFFIILFSVSIGGTILIEKGREWVVLIILFCLVCWIILLHIWKREIKEKYKKLLYFSHKFYKKVKKVETDKYDFEDYTLGDFEEEFEDWLRDEYIKKVNL